MYVTSLRKAHTKMFSKPNGHPPPTHPRLWEAFVISISQVERDMKRWRKNFRGKTTLFTSTCLKVNFRDTRLSCQCGNGRTKNTGHYFLALKEIH